MTKLEKIIRFCDTCEKKKIFIYMGRDDKYKYYGCKKCGHIIDIKSKINYNLNGLFMTEKQNGRLKD
jgi:hypothetical protein